MNFKKIKTDLKVLGFKMTIDRYIIIPIHKFHLKIMENNLRKSKEKLKEIQIKLKNL